MRWLWLLVPLLLISCGRPLTEGEAALEHLKNTALSGGNIFEALVEAAKVCTLGQMSHALYEVGGQYRRNT